MLRRIVRAGFALAVLAVAGCAPPEPDDAASTTSDSAPPIDAAPAPPTGRAAPLPAETEPDLAGDLRTALERLVRGPVEPRGPDSEHTWFSAATAHVLDSVSVDTAGRATVDFHDLRPLIPNASTSAGSALLLRELNEAVFGVDGIESVEYRIAGSCQLFWEWLQYGCQIVTRAQAAEGGT